MTVEQITAEVSRLALEADTGLIVIRLPETTSTAVLVQVRDLLQKSLDAAGIDRDRVVVALGEVELETLSEDRLAEIGLQRIPEE